MSRLVVPFRWLLAVSLFAVAALVLEPIQAQDEGRRGFALLVGVRNYDHADLTPLQNTENDVEGLAKLLDRPGSPFHGNVRLLTSTRGKRAADDAPTAANIRKEVGKLIAGRKRGELVLLALSGHGIQLAVRDPAGQERDRSYGYFCPADADLVRPDFATGRHARLVLLAELFEELGGCGAGSKLVLMDACRNEMKVRSRSLKVSRELVPEGVDALFSCKTGEVAYESEKLGHGIFFHYVLQGLKGEAANRRGEVTWSRLAEYVTDKVSDDAPTLVGNGASQTPQRLMYAAGKSPVLLTGMGKEMVNSIGMKLVRIPAGKFVMGPPDDADWPEIEISKEFYLGRFEVTRGQFRKFVEDSGYVTQQEKDDGVGFVWNPDTETHDRHALGYSWRKVSFTQTDNHPVVLVSWHDAREFCTWLSKKEGKEYRLPTEAEWEYACRAGTTTAYYWGDEDSGARDHANHADQSLDRKAGAWLTSWGTQSYDWDDKHPFTAPVGSFKPNAWGLYDMNGNALEWTADYRGPLKGLGRKDPHRAEPAEGEEAMIVMRGGEFNRRAVQSGYRNRWFGPAARADYAGFRVVCVPAAGE